MQERHSKTNFDATIAEDMYTDTSMFSADEIVRHMEAAAAEFPKQSKTVDSDAKRRLEILREQKRLAQDLMDMDSFDLDE